MICSVVNSGAIAAPAGVSGAVGAAAFAGIALAGVFMRGPIYDEAGVPDTAMPHFFVIPRYPHICIVREKALSVGVFFGDASIIVVYLRSDVAPEITAAAYRYASAGKGVVESFEKSCFLSCHGVRVSFYYFISE